MEIMKDHVFLLMAFVGFISTVVGVVVWLVRLEAGMKQNASDIRGLWRQRHEDQEATKQARHETNQLLRDINTKMDSTFSEIRADIKQILAGSKQ